MPISAATTAVMVTPPNKARSRSRQPIRARPISGPASAPSWPWSLPGPAWQASQDPAAPAQTYKLRAKLNKELNVQHLMAPQLPRQDLRRWGNSLGVRLPAAIAREARLHDNQTVELKVVADGVLIRPVQPRLSLAERLAAYTPMAGEATEAMAWDPIGTEVIE